MAAPALGVSAGGEAGAFDFSEIPEVEAERFGHGPVEAVAVIEHPVALVGMPEILQARDLDLVPVLAAVEVVDQFVAAVEPDHFGPGGTDEVFHLGRDIEFGFPAACFVAGAEDQPGEGVAGRDGWGDFLVAQDTGVDEIAPEFVMGADLVALEVAEGGAPANEDLFIGPEK